MTHGSLFNGIGGFQLAAAWRGWENLMSCEIDDFCNKVTKQHFPNCIQHGDIKTTDFSIYRGRIDILTGGFPCQPFSTAGKRKGTADDRHLWPEMLRAIREISPLWIVGENVRGLVSWNEGMVFEQVQTDLEAEGYQVLPFLLPACAVNAPHRRERIWIVAYASNNGSNKNTGEFQKTPTEIKSEEQREERTKYSGNGTGEGLQQYLINRGLLPTPEANNFKTGHKTISGRIERKIDQGWTIGLNDLATLGMLPAPTARDYRSGFNPESDAMEARRNHSRGVNLHDETIQRKIGNNFQLNPLFVEEMMGFPIGWTELKPLETQ